MQSSSVPRGFFFGSLSSKQSSSSSSKSSPRYTSCIVSERVPGALHPPVAESRSRSGSTSERSEGRKRSSTISSTVDHLTSFWESKKEKHKEKEHEKKMEKQATRDRAVSKAIAIIGKEPTRLNERHDKKGHREESKSLDIHNNHYHQHQHNFNNQENSRVRSNTKEASIVISSEVLEAVKGLPGFSPSSSSSVPSSSSTYIPYTPSSTTVSFTASEPRVVRDGRVKHKARSEGSLLSLIFSKRFDRGGLMQKSSSLIELKALPAPAPEAPKSGSALQIGKKPGYFGVTLQEAMDMQKEKYPNLRIPVIMVKLTEAILLFEGRKAEGIFRVAGSIQQIQKMQQQFNEMNFDEISSDPHVLVGVLKQWLRTLKEPLITNDIYSECLKCETPDDCVRAVSKMPELNQAALAHFVGFLRELSKPECLPFTRMDVHNLCLVSAPVLFRCPSTDMAELVVHMQKEKVFLGLLLESSFK